jgi:hypothetical protein
MDALVVGLQTLSNVSVLTIFNNIIPYNHLGRSVFHTLKSNSRHERIININEIRFATCERRGITPQTQRRSLELS